MDCIRKYFPDLTENQYQQFDQLQELYEYWNDQINVISRKNLDELYVNHVLHSLAIAKYVEFDAGEEILDVGTGGGFPGIPLAILFPEVKFHLVDSIGKKIKVVNGVKDALGLTNVVAEQVRMETINKKYDFIVSRAVAQTDQLHQWLKGKVKPIKGSGYLLLKGGDLRVELNKFCKRSKVDRHSINQISLTDYFEEDFFETKCLLHIPLF